MSRKKDEPGERLAAAEQRLRSLSADVARLERRARKQEAAVRSVSHDLERCGERDRVIMDALGLNDQSKRGDKGFLGDISESVLHLDEYLLRNSERIDTILVTLKNHRELLMRMNDSSLVAGERDRIRLELSVMRNTASIMALAGVDLDVSLLKEIKAIQSSLESAQPNMAELRRTKERLERRFSGEVKRFDIESLYMRRRDIPGYG